MGSLYFLESDRFLYRGQPEYRQSSSGQGEIGSDATGAFPINAQNQQGECPCEVYGSRNHHVVQKVLAERVP